MSRILWGDCEKSRGDHGEIVTGWAIGAQMLMTIEEYCGLRAWGDNPRQTAPGNGRPGILTTATLLGIKIGIGDW
jgi:hypothetical protein